MSCMGKTFIFQEGCDDKNIQEGIVYVCREDEKAYLKCPCGCGDVLTLNLIPDTHPGWTISGNSIKPSINRIIGCRSHFTITNGITN